MSRNVSCGECETCPFAFTDESEMVQNYGCLPTIGDIADMNNTYDVNWACHHDDKKVCSGLAKAFGDEYLGKLFTREKFDKNLPLVSYEEWYEHGEEKAIELARERVVPSV